MEYTRPFFTSENKNTEKIYGLGIFHLEKKEYYKAYDNFAEAARDGHASACYNLYLMICSGIAKYFDIDLAVDYLKKAADLGHPSAKSNIKYLEAADAAGIGYDFILDQCKNMPVPAAGVQPWMMLVTTRYTKAICKKFNATNEFLQMCLYFRENDPWFKKYFEEFNIYFGCYFNGIDFSGNGGAADQISEYIQKLFFLLRDVGYEECHIQAVIYTIIGYVLNTSELIETPTKLMGIKDFSEIYNSVI